MNNLVIFKGTIDGLTVILDKEAPFKEVIESFQNKLIDSTKFLEGAKVGLQFKGRELDEEEQDQIIEMLGAQNILDISFVHPFSEEIINGECEKPSSKTVISKETSLTYYHYGVLRSGQTLEYDGSIVILGDVNSGAVVTAGKNIVVLGSLNGRAHAGKDLESTDSFIVALKMNPDLLGIGECIAHSPESNKRKIELEYMPQIAHLAQNTIYVDKIDFKTLNHMVE